MAFLGLASPPLSKRATLHEDISSGQPPAAGTEVPKFPPPAIKSKQLVGPVGGVTKTWRTAASARLHYRACKMKTLEPVFVSLFSK